MNIDKLLPVIGKGVAYPVLWLTILYFIARIALPFTLGMASDLVVLAVPIVALIGLLLLLWLGLLMIKDFHHTLSN